MREEQLFSILKALVFLAIVFTANDYLYKKFLKYRKTDAIKIYFPKFKYIFILFFTFMTFFISIMILARYDSGFILNRDYGLLIALLISLIFLALQLVLRPVFYFYENKIVIDYGFKRHEVLDTYFKPHKFIFILKKIAFANHSMYVAGEYSFLLIKEIDYKS